MLYRNTTDFYVEAARGTIPGFSVVNKFGHNADIDIGVAEDVWDVGANWTAPTAAVSHTIVSTDADDAGTVLSSGTATDGTTSTIEDSSATFVSDGVAAGDIVLNDTRGTYGHVISATETEITVWMFHSGPKNAIGTKVVSGNSYRVVTTASTGAAVLYVFGLDGSYESVREFVVLNGLSGVTTSNLYWNIFRMRALLAGGSGFNEGAVTATATGGGGTVTAQITATRNQTLMAVYQVPEGYNALLMNAYVSLALKSNAIIDGAIWAQPWGEPLQIREFRAIHGTGTSILDINRKIPPVYAPRTILKVRAESDTVNTGVSGGFDLLLARANK